MLLLQIRQAEVALADGRLEEAYRLVQSDHLRSHRRGQALITSLVEALLRRGRAHLESGRPIQALWDCEKAQQLGGNLDAVLALRNQIEQTVVSQEHARRNEAQAGILQAAANLVDSALARQDLDRAVVELIRARGNGCNDHRLRELDGNVRMTLQEQIQTALNVGRLDQVQGLMDQLVRIDAEALETQRLSRCIDQVRAAWVAVDRGRPQDAADELRRLAAQLPEAKWIDAALQHLEMAEQSLRAVRTGPLGLLAAGQATFERDALTRIPRVAYSPPELPSPHPLGPSSGQAASGTDLPRKFIVQVDGAGSCLVLRQSCVTLGPISSSRLPDVALIAEPDGQIARIERVEEDYFLRGEAGAGKLLSAGDRITISPRCRLQFNLPNPSSTSAVLDLVSGRLPRADVRRIILLDRDLVIGPGASAHIRADQLSQPLVLHVRDDRLWHRNEPIALQTPVTMEGISLVVSGAT